MPRFVRIKDHLINTAEVAFFKVEKNPDGETVNVFVQTNRAGSRWIQDVPKSVWDMIVIDLT